MSRVRSLGKPTRRRALDLLASCPDGCFEGLLVAHGFSIPFIVRLVRAGLATAHTERVVAGGRRLEVARVRITEAGRRALAERPPRSDPKLTRGLIAKLIEKIKQN
jgi:hypothetical protein